MNKFVHLVKYQTDKCDEELIIFPPQIASKIAYELHMIYKWEEQDKKFRPIREYRIHNKELFGFNSECQKDYGDRGITYDSLENLLATFDLSKLDTIAWDTMNHAFNDYKFDGFEFRFAFQYEADNYQDDNFKVHFDQFKEQLDTIVAERTKEATERIEQIRHSLLRAVENNKKMLQHDWSKDVLLQTK